MRCSASSSRIINSPIFARARVRSRSSGSARVLSPRVPVSRNRRFQLSSSCAGIWLSRETPSKGSPRSSRSTSSVFRCTLHRSGSSTLPLAPDSSAGAVVGFRAFFPMSASLVTTMISQTGVQRNRVRYMLTELDAFYVDHRRCGDLDAGVDGPMFWMPCDCGARMARQVEEDDDAGRVAPVHLT